MAKIGMLKAPPLWDIDFYRAVAARVIKQHTDRGECLFSPSAVEDIARAAAEADSQFERDRTKIIDAIERSVRAAEIYCPHEGIDRRAEFGIAA